MTKRQGPRLWALRVWPNSSPQSEQWSATVTRHKRDTDLWFFHHWGYVDTLTDKSDLLIDFKRAGLEVSRRDNGWQVTVSPAR